MLAEVLRIFATYIRELYVIFKLNRVRTGVERFHLSMRKWGLAPSLNCKGSVTEKTADHALTACPIRREQYGAQSLTVLNDETGYWHNTIIASI